MTDTANKHDSDARREHYDSREDFRERLSGLRLVAKLSGGLVVKSGKEVAKYDKDGRKIDENSSRKH